MTSCAKCGAEVAPDAPECPSCHGRLHTHTLVSEDTFLGRALEGKFQILELIGRGGMSRVYRANQLSLNKTVCVKVLSPDLMRDGTYVRRFQREAEAASRLSHPHIVQVIDFGQDAQSQAPYLVLEYVQGRTLGKLLEEEKPLAEARIVDLVAQALSALADAHACGIVHRDIKPANLMVTELRDRKDFVKVLDFGIARVESPVSGESSLTQAGMVCGTPEYMSPEQIRGQTCDARSDLYAVGVILYQLVTGRLPFSGTTPMDIVAKHLSDPPVPPSQSGALPVSERLEALILKALAKDPIARPQDALAMQKELYAVLEPAGAAGPVSFAQVQGFLRSRLRQVWTGLPGRGARSPRAVGLAGVGALALALLFALWPASPPPGPFQGVRGLLRDGKFPEAAALLQGLPERGSPEGKALEAEIAILGPAQDLEGGGVLLRGAIDGQRAILDDPDARKALLQTLDQKDSESTIALISRAPHPDLIDDLVAAAADQRYWLRWNSVKALRALKADDRVDQPLLYINDLKHASSCSTRRAAAQQLGKLGDKRALEPLRAAQKRGFFDNLCMGDALEKAIQALE